MCVFFWWTADHIHIHCFYWFKKKNFSGQVHRGFKTSNEYCCLNSAQISTRCMQFDRNASWQTSTRFQTRSDLAANAVCVWPLGLLLDEPACVVIGLWCFKLSIDLFESVVMWLTDWVVWCKVSLVLPVGRESVNYCMEVVLCGWLVFWSTDKITILRGGGGEESVCKHW